MADDWVPVGGWLVCRFVAGLVILHPSQQIDELRFLALGMVLWAVKLGLVIVLL